MNGRLAPPPIKSAFDDADTKAPSLPWLKWFQNLISAFNDPYTTYTPTLSSVSGTYTSASVKGRFKQVGRLVFIKIEITITTQGTATFAIITLPVAANSEMHQVVSGVEILVNGKGCTGEVGFGGNFSQVALRNADNTAPGGDGSKLIVSGVYEAA